MDKKETQETSRLKLRVFNMIEVNLDAENKPVNWGITAILFAIAVFIILGGVALLN